MRKNEESGEKMFTAIFPMLEKKKWNMIFFTITEKKKDKKKNNNK